MKNENLWGNFIWNATEEQKSDKKAYEDFTQRSSEFPSDTHFDRNLKSLSIRDMLAQKALREAKERDLAEKARQQARLERKRSLRKNKRATTLVERLQGSGYEINYAMRAEDLIDDSEQRNDEEASKRLNTLLKFAYRKPKNAENRDSSQKVYNKVKLFCEWIRPAPQQREA